MARLGKRERANQSIISINAKTKPSASDRVRIKSSPAPWSDNTWTSKHGHVYVGQGQGKAIGIDPFIKAIDRDARRIEVARVKEMESMIDNGYARQVNIFSDPL